MNPPTKRSVPIGWSCVAIVSFVLTMLLPYLEGRSNDLWIIPPMLPATLLPLLSLLVSCVALFGVWRKTLGQPRGSVAAFGMFVLSVLLLGTAIRSRQADRYHRGFTRYARTVLTPDEWRLLSRVAREQSGPDGRLPGPENNLWNEKLHRPRWVALCAATQIRKLSPDMMIFVRPDEVEIVWGGALVGHRGLVVYTDRVPATLPRGSGGPTFIAEDIATFVSPD